jgi:hypothetical protein
MLALSKSSQILNVEAEKVSRAPVEEGWLAVRGQTHDESRNQIEEHRELPLSGA